MALVATLVSSPAAPQVTPALLDAAAAAVGGRPRWLFEGIAADIDLPGDAHGDTAAKALRAVLAGAAVDTAVLPADGRRKRLLLADMDSTIIGQECIDELADTIGIKPQIAAITERAMRGEIAFEPALEERVALLAGVPAAAIERLLAERITLNPGARTLVATMRAAGAHTVLVSGGFTAFTKAIAARAGFHEHRANRLLVSDGRLTGRVAEPILGREAKTAALAELRTRLGLAPAATLVVGDGANDLGMIEQAGLGAAYRAKPAVATRAAARIDHGDLTALLYLQGYARDEFVEG
jgi:phosphoserine phosphatase